MKIGIIGNGVVGNATAKAFEGFVDEVRITDRIRAKKTHQLSDVLECDPIFICLPTPQVCGQLHGWLACDTSAIDSFFKFGLPDRFRTANFVLRSTVPVGYTRKISRTYNLPNLVHSPEFLTARTAVEDARNPTRSVIGTPNDGHPPGSIYNLYRMRWPNVRCWLMSSDESEAVKLFQNAFSAVKIACFNEFRAFADAAKLDWDIVIDTVLAGGWINPMHTQVPGPDGKRGFGGACLPKDLANLVDCFWDFDSPGYVCQAALEWARKE